ncbi:MAG: CDP-alcohol phosphatidyltransferase family protein [Pseudomonadota bacterium]
MTDVTPQEYPTPPMKALPPSTRLCGAGLAGLPLVLGAAFLLVGANFAALALAVGAHTVGFALALRLVRRGYPHPDLGLCNLVTMARLALTAALVAPLAGAANPWSVFAIAAIALSLDGADGWLARREGRVSSFGARLDVEVDSALALILALNAWAAGTTGAVVLLLGLPRYAFMAAAQVYPHLSRPLPERFSRKAVCVLQAATLIALQLPPLAMTFSDPLVALVGAALIWSFGRDVVWLHRART